MVVRCLSGVIDRTLVRGVTVYSVRDGWYRGILEIQHGRGAEFAPGVPGI